MKIPATLQKLRNRCSRPKKGSPDAVFGPKRSKSSAFYFQDVNTEDLELLTKGFSSPSRPKSLRYSCAPPDSPASTPGYYRKMHASPSRPTYNRLLGQSEPIINSSSLDPIRQTSLGILSKNRHHIRRAMTMRPISMYSMDPVFEDYRKCCPDNDCVLCTLVRPELRGRHVPSISNPSFVRNFD